MSDCLKIISSTLFNALVSGYRRIARRSSQVLTILVWDVLTLTVSIALCQAKVNDINCVFGRFCSSNEEIVWLNVAMDDALLVDFLNPGHHLNRDHQACLQVERPLACLE